MTSDLVKWLVSQSEGLSYADTMGDTFNGRRLRLARWRLREAADRIEALELCLRNVLPLLDETAPEVAASARALEAK